MTEAGGEAGLAAAGPERAPSLRRRMACFVYESMLLFGVSLVPGALGALFFAQTGQRHPLQSETALRVFAWVLYGVYFVWFWSARGQTLAMQTWHIGVVSAGGQRLTQLRALARYAACCIAWFALPTLAALVLHLAPWPSLALTAAWIARLRPARPRRAGSASSGTTGSAAPAWSTRAARAAPPWLRPRPR